MSSDTLCSNINDIIYEINSFSGSLQGLEFVYRSIESQLDHLSSFISTKTLQAFVEKYEYVTSKKSKYANLNSSTGIIVEGSKKQKGSLSDHLEKLSNHSVTDHHANEVIGLILFLKENPEQISLLMESKDQSLLGSLMQTVMKGTHFLLYSVVCCALFLEFSLCACVFIS
jgi:hypothetical protein